MKHQNKLVILLIKLQMPYDPNYYHHNSTLIIFRLVVIQLPFHPSISLNQMYMQIFYFLHKEVILGLNTKLLFQYRALEFFQTMGFILYTYNHCIISKKLHYRQVFFLRSRNFMVFHYYTNLLLVHEQFLNSQKVFFLINMEFVQKIHLDILH